MRGHTDHINRCTRCGDYGCYGTCTEYNDRWGRCEHGMRAVECPEHHPIRATENDLDNEELEPLEGDSYDDARWATLQQWADEEGGEA